MREYWNTLHSNDWRRISVLLSFFCVLLTFTSEKSGEILSCEVFRSDALLFTCKYWNIIIFFVQQEATSRELTSSKLNGSLNEIIKVVTSVLNRDKEESSDSHFRCLNKILYLIYYFRAFFLSAPQWDFTFSSTLCRVMTNEAHVTDWLTSYLVKIAILFPKIYDVCKLSFTEPKMWDHNSIRRLDGKNKHLLVIWNSSIFCINRNLLTMNGVSN